MTAYVVAQLSIHDRGRYERYVRAFMPVLNAHGGRLLVADEAPQVLEGAWPRDKLIVLAFESREAARAWSRSPAYRQIAADREAATEAVVLLAEGP